nr:hypothetical protein [uncultured Flavobacterium sp.]
MKNINIFILFFTFIFFGCTKEDEQSNNCLSYKHEFITNVELDSYEINKNEDLIIEVSFFIMNSCGSFYSFDVERNNAVYEIKVKSKYEGCVCAELAELAKQKFHFRSAEEGIYTLNFYTSNTEFITKVIEVK